MDDLLALAHKACDESLAAGAEFADVGAHRGRSLSVDLEKGAIRSCEARWNAGVSVRAFSRGGQGFCRATGLDESEALSAARNAAELAQAAQPDPDFVTLPPPAAYPKVEGLYDGRVAELEASDLVRWAVENIDAAREVAPEVIVTGGGESGWHESALVNSLGLEASDRSSHVGLSIFAIIKRGDEVGSYFEYDNGRMLDDFSPDGIGARAAREALKFLGARKIQTATMPVVFGPLASHSIFWMLCSSANAEGVQRKRSFLIGKKGRKIGSDLLTLTDDGLIPRGLSSASFDGEGVPHRPLTVVREGVLLSWLHNSYTAKKAKEDNTGHSTRGGISPTNVNPKLGALPAEQIIRDTKEGLYVPAGFISPNMASGDFSTSVDFGLKIEKGELAYPVKNTMIAGNVLEFFRNLDAVSSDARREPGSIMPTVRVSGLRVAGGK
jgi:PmbA protein